MKRSFLSHNKFTAIDKVVKIITGFELVGRSHVLGI
jgi:hypothetical protein